MQKYPKKIDNWVKKKDLFSYTMAKIREIQDIFSVSLKAYDFFLILSTLFFYIKTIKYSIFNIEVQNFYVLTL